MENVGEKREVVGARLGDPVLPAAEGSFGDIPASGREQHNYVAAAQPFFFSPCPKALSLIMHGCTISRPGKIMQQK